MNSKLPWKLGGIYFLYFLAVSILLSGIISTLFVTFLPDAISPGSITRAVVGILINISIMLLAVIAASYLTVDKIHRNQIQKVAVVAVMYSLILSGLHLIRDLLITEFNGIPVKQEPLLSLLFIPLNMLLFYFMSIYVLNKMKDRKAHGTAH